MGWILGTFNMEEFTLDDMQQIMPWTHDLTHIPIHVDSLYVLETHIRIHVASPHCDLTQIGIHAAWLQFK